MQGGASLGNSLCSLWCWGRANNPGMVPATKATGPLGSHLPPPLTWYVHRTWAARVLAHFTVHQTTAGLSLSFEETEAHKVK